MENETKEEKGSNLFSTKTIHQIMCQLLTTYDKKEKLGQKTNFVCTKHCLRSCANYYYMYIIR
jgi:hypothetical protein